MLNPHRSKDIKFLIIILVFLDSKPITLNGRSRGRGGFPVGSNFLNHDAKRLKEKQQQRPRKENKENQGQTASKRVRAQKYRKEKSI